MKKKIYEAPTTIVFVTTLQNILAGSTGSTGGGSSSIGGGPNTDSSSVDVPGGDSGGSGGDDSGDTPVVEAKPNTHPWSEWDD